MVRIERISAFRFSPSLSVRVSFCSLLRCTFPGPLLYAFIKYDREGNDLERKAREIALLRQVRAAYDRHVNARRHIITKTCRLKREFLALRKLSAGSQNARKITCRTHLLNESLHTDPTSLVSKLSITSEHRDDDEAINRWGQSLP